MKRAWWEYVIFIGLLTASYHLWDKGQSWLAMSFLIIAHTTMNR